MVRAINRQTNQHIRQIVEQISSSGQMTRQEHLQLTSRMLSNYKLSEEERRQINQAFDQVHTGHLTIVD